MKPPLFYLPAPAKQKKVDAKQPSIFSAMEKAKTKASKKTAPTMVFTSDDDDDIAVIDSDSDDEPPVRKPRKKMMISDSEDSFAVGSPSPASISTVPSSLTSPKASDSNPRTKSPVTSKLGKGRKMWKTEGKQTCDKTA